MNARKPLIGAIALALAAGGSIAATKVATAAQEPATAARRAAPAPTPALKAAAPTVAAPRIRTAVLRLIDQQSPIYSGGSPVTDSNSGIPETYDDVTVDLDATLDGSFFANMPTNADIVIALHAPGYCDALATTSPNFSAMAAAQPFMIPLSQLQKGSLPGTVIFQA
jgi:hypothetical protein